MKSNQDVSASSGSVREQVEIWGQNDGVKIHSFAQLDSTNTFARTLEWPEIRACVVVCDHQTHGRGRGTNVWTDNGNGQLLASWVFKLIDAPQPIATPRIGLSLFLAAEKAWPTGDWSLKAPNDLLISGKKVGGLLLEVISQGDEYRLIVGLGLNINNHPADVLQSASIEKHVKNAMDRLALFLEQWWLELEDALVDLVHPEMPTNICANLCAALNKNRNLADTYTRVHGNGSLESTRGTVHWGDL